MVNDEINDILDYLKFEFKYGTLKNRLVALEEIDKIKRLKEQVKNSDSLILNSQNEAIKYEKIYIYIYCVILQHYKQNYKNITYTNQKITFVILIYHLKKIKAY